MTDDALLIAVQAFVDRKYVSRADDRQRSMGLAYVEAERTDLAREIVAFIKRLPLLCGPAQEAPDPEELWEEYLDEIPDHRDRSPQSALAFAWHRLSTVVAPPQQGQDAYPVEKFKTLTDRARNSIEGQNWGDAMGVSEYAAIDMAVMFVVAELTGRTLFEWTSSNPARLQEASGKGGA